MEHKSILDKVRAYFTESVRRHGDSARGADWKDAASQNLRFEVLAGLFRAGKGFSLLDVGCGTAALLGYLRENGWRGIDYTGIDVSPAMIEKAREKFSGLRGARFLVQSLEETRERYDYVVSSGILNRRHGIGEKRWGDYVLEVIRRQFAAARIGAAFNILTTYVDFRAPQLYYCDPKMIIDYCRRELSPYVTIRHDYPLYEFTAYVYRAEEGKDPGLR